MINECQRCSEPIESPATLCTDCRVVTENYQEALRALRLAAIPIVERESRRVKALEKVAEAARDEVLGNALIFNDRFPNIRAALAELDRVSGDERRREDENTK